MILDAYAMIFIAPPQCSHTVTSIRKTRFNRCAHLASRLSYAASPRRHNGEINKSAEIWNRSRSFRTMQCLARVYVLIPRSSGGMDIKSMIGEIRFTLFLHRR